MQTKFIFVIGGVISGLGKGITTASLGKLLQYQGFSVTAIKIDPYINQDAGTMRPTEHGEVWVTEDGGEIDQDLGNYERFLGIEIPRNHNITNGTVWSSVTTKERRGEYLGSTVMPIPHVTNEIEQIITRIAKKDDVDFALIEIGGVVGDYENKLFLEASHRMGLKYPTMNMFIGYLPIPPHLGEMKTKPIQHAIQRLGEHNIKPDIVIGRATQEVDEVRKEKIAISAGILLEDVISNQDVNNIYKIPLILEEQDLCEIVLKHFDLEYKIENDGLNEWRNFIERIDSITEKITVGVVGKYFDIGDSTLSDSYISVLEAIKHASWNNNVNPEIKWIDSKKYEDNLDSIKELDNVDCVIVPGGFGISGIEGKIMTAKYCRENNIPYLGLCLGLQIAVIEYARNVCGLEDANSSEFDPDTKHAVISTLQEQKRILEESDYGGTMRLGGYKAKLKPGTIVHELYGGADEISERHRHRYEISSIFDAVLEENGFVFSGYNPEREVMEFGELPRDIHPYFVGTQAHPEFKSRPMKPAPLFDGLIKATIKQKHKNLD